MQTLFNTLKEQLQLPDKKINFFVRFIESIIEKKTINLDEIAELINPNNIKESNYRILQRFFKDFNLCFTALAKILMNSLSRDKKILIVDRTQWKEINIYFLSVEYQGVAIPILWNLLDKKGNTNTLERKDLIEDYVNIFGLDSIDYLTADREFIGKEHNIHFLIRIKANFIASNGITRKKVKGIFRYYEGKVKMLDLFGINLKIMGKRINSKDLLIVATNSPNLVLNDYSNRWLLILVEVWLIETMFSCFKKRGFKLESTKMTDNYKIDKLVAFISIAYLWCIIASKSIKTNDSKIRKDSSYPRKSTFKIGAEILTKAITQKHLCLEYYQTLSKVFGNHNQDPRYSVVV